MIEQPIGAGNALGEIGKLLATSLAKAQRDLPALTALLLLAASIHQIRTGELGLTKQGVMRRSVSASSASAAPLAGIRGNLNALLLQQVREDHSHQSLLSIAGLVRPAICS